MVGEAKRRKLNDGEGSVASLGSGSEIHSSLHGSGVSSSPSGCNGFVDLKEEDTSSDTETWAHSNETKLLSEVRDEESGEFMENSSSTIKSAGEEDSTAEVSDSECSCSCQRTPSTAPTEAELEDFFSAAEKQQSEKLAEKYNFDFIKEKPQEGRYEWVKLSE